MIDKAIVRSHPDINKLMGCIDSSFYNTTFWTYLFSVNKQIRWKKYLEVKKEVESILKFTGDHNDTLVMVNFVFEDKSRNLKLWSTNRGSSFRPVTNKRAKQRILPK